MSPAPYGVTTTGFSKPTYDELLGLVYDSWEAAFGADARQSAETTGTPDNKICKIFAASRAEDWEAMEEVYNSKYRSTSDGVQLENAADIVGVNKLAATRSTVTETLIGAVATTIAQYALVKTSTVGDFFRTTAAITLSASGAVRWEIATNGALATGNYTVTVDGTPYTYAATVPADTEAVIFGALAGTITAVSGLTAVYNAGDGELVVTSDADAVTGLPVEINASLTANMKFNEVGNLQAMESVETGPIIAYAGNLTVATLTTGWTSATNTLAATVGTNIETDAELRIRAARSVAIPGASVLDAIYANVADVSGVTAALVISNRTETVDANGTTAKSIHAIVLGGTDAAIAARLWAVVGATSGMDGSTTENVVDAQGATQAVKFSRPTQVPMSVRITRTNNTEEEYPANGDDLIIAAVLAYGNLHSMGNDVIPDRFYGSVFGACSGTLTVTVEVKKTAGGVYSTAPYSVDYDEIATFSSGSITVV
jgi:hypothetical protein